jgi:hypothetical protein
MTYKASNALRVSGEHPDTIDRIERTVCIWPDGSWCRGEHVEGYMHMAHVGDDYESIVMDEVLSDEAVDHVVYMRDLHRADKAQHPIWMAHDREGLVYVNIQGGEYTYAVDAALIPSIRKQFVYAPWKALQQLIKRCRWYADPKGVLHECE